MPDDPVASAEFRAAVYLPLLHDVRADHRAEDPDRIVDVVTDLLIAFVKRPEQYESDKLSIRGYLMMAVRGDILNARRTDTNRWAHEIPLDSVAEPESDGKEVKGGDVRSWLDDPRVASVIAGFDDTDRAAWELMRSASK